MENLFTTYVRTKTVFNHRLKDLKDYDTVKIHLYELDKLNVKGYLLHSLKEKGEIWYDDDGNFRALNKGPVDPLLLEKTKKWKREQVPLTGVHEYMKNELRFVTIAVSKNDLPVYFRAFIEHGKSCLDPFFTVDAFSGRVHTPVVNLKGHLRDKLRLRGKRLCSLDVKQMQPTILSKLLYDNIGANPFTEAISKGTDIYLLLMSTNKELVTRDDAKKMLYRLIFGYPMNDISQLFNGDTKWVDWINQVKSKEDIRNPHSRDPHTNLAWMLQSKEVEVMSNIWTALKDVKIHFLTIHDDILVPKANKTECYKIMYEELNKHFTKFEIVVKHY